jgi:2-phosphosulfolactate phosphatase
MSADPYSQLAYRCRLEWGVGGAIRAARRGDIIVIVDVLSFSTSTAIACDLGASIVPAADDIEANELAQQFGYEVAVRRQDVPRLGRYSLSPVSFTDAHFTRPIVLPSPNGATASLASNLGGTVLIGAFVNARAVTDAVNRLLETDGAITLVACGERWPEAQADGRIRFALEDFLGAGALANAIDVEKSPEALAAAAAYRALEKNLIDIVSKCGSANELHAIGYERDVEIALSIDYCDSVPSLREGIISDLDTRR